VDKNFKEGASGL